MIRQIILMTEERKVPTKYLLGIAYKFRCILLEFERIILYPASFSSRCLFILTSFMSVVLYIPPEKNLKTSGFPLFSGGTERDQWHEIG